MYLFPAIDLRDGQVVRLKQGDYGRQTTYGDNPVAQAKLFEAAGASWLHVVDLDGARTGDLTHLEVIGAICSQTNLKVEVGGGVRSEEVINQLLGVGVERVVLGTAALHNWSWFKSLMDVEKYHSKLVLGLDAKAGRLAIHGWEQEIEATALDIAQDVTDWPLAAIVYTDIATDGMLTGPNVEATKEMAEVTKVPVVASGGVGSLDDLRALRELPVQGAIVGRALYENAVTIDDALAVFEGGK